MGAALLQGKQPVSYHSDLALGWFSGQVLNSSTYDKKLYPPVQAVNKWVERLLESSGDKQ